MSDRKKRSFVSKGVSMFDKGKKKLASKVKYAAIGAVAGLVLGIGGTVFVQNFNPADEKQLSASVVFDRIVEKNELVSASQSYNITDKASDVNTFFDLFDIPIKAGVDLDNAEFAQQGNVIKVTLDQPFIISNTPDMEASGVLEENNNILNPIHVEDVDEFQSLCVELSQQSVLDGGLMDEARKNAEQDIRDMFNAALGSDYPVEFEWRELDEAE